MNDRLTERGATAYKNYIRCRIVLTFTIICPPYTESTGCEN